jgi:hypothetical protein
MNVHENNMEAALQTSTMETSLETPPRVSTTPYKGWKLETFGVSDKVANAGRLWMERIHPLRDSTD